MKVRELNVFTVRLEKEKLAKDAKTLIKIFAILEELSIPVECVAINIDWFAVTMRMEQKSKMVEYMAKVTREIRGMNIILGDEFKILSMEEDEFNTRRIGMYLSFLELQGIDILMCRQIKNNQKLVFGFKKEQFERAKEIIQSVENETKR